MKASDANSGQSVSNRNVLVVGKNSYIGRFLCQHLSTQGAIVSGVGSSDCNFLNAARAQEFFKSFRGKPLTIVFLAVVNKQVDNSYGPLIDNLNMIWNFASNVHDLEIESLIYFSSVDVYGRSPVLPMTEMTALDPDTWYGLAKYNSEWIVREELSPKFPTCILRIPGIFGCAPNDRSVIGRLVSSIRREGKASIQGDGRVLRDFVYAPDLCRVVEQLIARRASGTFNVATGKSFSLLQILEAIRETLAIDFDIVHLPGNGERNFDMCYDIAKLSAAVGGFDFSPLAAGIRSYL